MNSNQSPLEQIEYNAELKTICGKYPEIIGWAEDSERLNVVIDEDFMDSIIKLIESMNVKGKNKEIKQEVLESLNDLKCDLIKMVE